MKWLTYQTYFFSRWSEFINTLLFCCFSDHASYNTWYLIFHFLITPQPYYSRKVSQKTHSYRLDIKSRSQNELLLEVHLGISIFSPLIESCMQVSKPLISIIDAMVLSGGTSFLGILYFIVRIDWLLTRSKSLRFDSFYIKETKVFILGHVGWSKSRIGTLFSNKECLWM